MLETFYMVSTTKIIIYRINFSLNQITQAVNILHRKFNGNLPKELERHVNGI